MIIVICTANIYWIVSTSKQLALSGMENTKLPLLNVPSLSVAYTASGSHFDSPRIWEEAKGQSGANAYYKVVSDYRQVMRKRNRRHHSTIRHAQP